MKHFVVACAFLCLCTQTPSQVKPSRAGLVEHFCHASEVITGPVADKVASIHSRLAPLTHNFPGHHIGFALVDSNEINAYTYPTSSANSFICLPIGIAKLMGDGEGELAFVIAHELGHALDDTCKSNQGRAEVTPPTLSGELDRLFGGTGRNLLAEQRQCESRADVIGAVLITKAGYSPFDAAGSLGRLEMLTGDYSTSLLARLGKIGRDHPITPDRIRNMHLLIAKLLQIQN